MARPAAQRKSAFARSVWRAETRFSKKLGRLNERDPRTVENLQDLAIKLGKKMPGRERELLNTRVVTTLGREDAKIVMPLIWPALRISPSDRVKVRAAKLILRPLLNSLQDAYETATETRPSWQYEDQKGKTPFDAYMDDAAIYLKEAQTELAARGIRGNIKGLPVLFYRTMEQIRQMRARNL